MCILYDNIYDIRVFIFMCIYIFVYCVDENVRFGLKSHARTPAHATATRQTTLRYTAPHTIAIHHTFATLAALAFACASQQIGCAGSPCIGSRRTGRLFIDDIRRGRTTQIWRRIYAQIRWRRIVRWPWIVRLIGAEILRGIIVKAAARRIRRSWECQQILVAVLVNRVDFQIRCFGNAGLARWCGVWFAAAAALLVLVLHVGVDLLETKVERLETDHAGIASDRLFRLFRIGGGCCFIAITAAGHRRTNTFDICRRCRRIVWTWTIIGN